jgi:hypothetical protein
MSSHMYDRMYIIYEMSHHDMVTRLLERTAPMRHEVMLFQIAALLA